MSLLEAQGYRCALTGLELTPENSSLDHKTPLSSGGKHVMSNVQLIVPDINTMKGTLSNDRFVELCRLVAGQNSPE